MTATATELAEAHAETLAKWQGDLQALDDELAELIEQEEGVRIEWQKGDPSRRSDGVGSPVTELRKKIDSLAGKRHRLAADVQAKQALLEELREHADWERQEQDLREAQAAITTGEVALAERWSTFVKLAEELRTVWAKVAETATGLDALPAGNAPVSPFPADLGRAFAVSLTEAGEQPFVNAPRISGRRLPLISSNGAGAMDLRGYDHTMQDTGTWK